MVLWRSSVPTSNPSGHCNLLRHPESDRTTHQPKPYHEVIFLGAVKVGHGISEHARMDEERRYAGDGMML